MSSSTPAIASQRMLFDYGELRGPDIKRCESAVERIDKLQRRMATDVITIGSELLTVKEKLEHGQFGAWIKHHFGWSHMTATKMMNVAAMFGDKIKQDLIFDTSALYLLSSDSCPDELRDDMLERAEKGERITHATVKKELDALTGEPDDDGEIEGGVIVEEWSPVECLSSIRNEVKRWLNICPVEERMFILETLQDIAAQIRKKSNND